MQQLGYNERNAEPGADKPAADAVQAQLARMLESPEFQNSERMSRFLRYVVEATLAGDEAALKESTVGVGVFDRSPTYSPKLDPVVRSEARRLREKIQRYYRTEGAADPVRLELPKGGYVASFQFLVPSPPVAPVDASPLTIPPPATRRRLPWPVVLFAGVAIGATLVLAFTWFAPRPARISPRTVYSLTSLPGQELDPAISPDGSQVAFIWDQNNGDFDLFTVPAAGGEPRGITSGPHRDMHPAYSPDGRTIAFLRTSPGGIEVWTVSFDGTNPRKITELRWFEWFNWRSDLHKSTGYPGPAWTPDGKMLILSDVAGAQQGAALWEFDVANGARRQISRPSQLAHDFFPAVSPDGRWVAFARQFSASVCDLYLTDRRTGEERRLTHDRHEIRGLSWMPDSQTLVYSSSRSGAFQLWRFPVFGQGEQEPVAVPGDRLLNPAIGRDGRLMVYTNASINLNLWRYSLDSGQPPRPLIVSTGSNQFPRYSPDGSRIAWASDRTSGWEIWVANADGTGQRQLTDFARRSEGRLLGTPRWSPDGLWIAFDARQSENCAIYVIPAAGGEPRLLERNLWEERNPSFSRDGKWVYFNSNRAGTVQVWKRPVGGGAPVRVTTRRGYDAIESPDGRTVYFLPALSEPGIWRVNADGSGEAVLLPTVPYFARRHWDLAGGRLYFLGHDSEPRTLLRLGAESASSVERLFTMERDLIADINSLTVSPDERWVTVSRPDVLRSDLMAVSLR